MNLSSEVIFLFYNNKIVQLILNYTWIYTYTMSIENSTFYFKSLWTDNELIQETLNTYKQKGTTIVT